MYGQSQYLNGPGVEVPYLFNRDFPSREGCVGGLKQMVRRITHSGKNHDGPLFNLMFHNTGNLAYPFRVGYRAASKFHYQHSIQLPEKFSSLLRFAHKISKNRRLGDFLPYKLPKQPMNRGFCGTKCRKNPQVQQAASVSNNRDLW
jgi:hypothetical protein